MTTPPLSNRQSSDFISLEMETWIDRVHDNAHSVSPESINSLSSLATQASHFKKVENLTLLKLIEVVQEIAKTKIPDPQLAFLTHQTIDSLNHSNRSYSSPSHCNRFDSPFPFPSISPFFMEPPKLHREPFRIRSESESE